MGTLSRTLLVACALVAGPVTAAAAADFRFPPEPVMPVPSAIPIPDYSNLWYLRGDFGYAFNEDPDISRSGTGFTGTEMEESWSIGAGFGYNFQDNVRGDITFEHRLKADMTGTNPTTGGLNNAELYSIFSLVNVYYEFRDRDHFAPYVGVGLGITYNELDDVTGGTAEDNNFDLAAAAMAGFSYRLDDQWLFDMGYRFLYLGEAQTNVNGGGGDLSVDGIYAHELRFGVRYELN